LAVADRDGSVLPLRAVYSLLLLGLWSGGQIASQMAVAVGDRLFLPGTGVKKQASKVFSRDGLP